MCTETCLVSLNNEPFCDRIQSHWDKHNAEYVLAYVPGGKGTQLRRYQQRSELLNTTQKASIDKMQVLWTAFFRCPKGIKNRVNALRWTYLPNQISVAAQWLGQKSQKKENSQTAYQRYLRAIEQVTRTGFEINGIFLLFSNSVRIQLKTTALIKTNLY